MPADSCCGNMHSAKCFDCPQTSIQVAAAAIKAKRPRKAKVEWVAPTLGDLAIGNVIALDQTINKTGYAVFWRDANGFGEWEHGTVRVEADPSLGGHADTLYRARIMSDKLRALISVWARMNPVVIHEMPAVHGYRTESSLLAAHAIQMASWEEGLRCYGVANQHMKKVIVGNAGASKAEVKKAVLALTGAQGTWNQDNSDALALGCTYLWDVAHG